jgi:hypothetical protein
MKDIDNKNGVRIDIFYIGSVREMDYQQVTEVIKEVTGLDIPVYFNDMEANCGGSPYFGIGNHAWDIMDEDTFDNPLIELTDLIENKHLKYYHVGLPDTILKNSVEHIYKVVGEQLKENGIEITLDKPHLETFIILHEFGHAHELFVTYKGDVEHYLSETIQENRHTSYQIKSYGLGGSEEGLRLHKSTDTEKYADNFALQYFESVVNVLKERNLY